MANYWSRPVVAVILAAAVLAPAEAEADRIPEGYVVSYLWASKAEPVVRYRTAVLRVLRSGAESRLAVVYDGGLYGLIGDGSGDLQSARRRASNHTRLLKAKGLEEAAVIKRRGWRPVLPARLLARQSAPLRRAPSRWRNLEQRVEAHIDALRREGWIARDERTAWSVYDFTANRKLVSINEERSLQAASMVKPFFALAFFHRAQEGRIIYGPKSRRMLERMIQDSDNRATNWVLRHLGGPRAVDRLLRREYGAIFQDTRIVEYIPRGGRTYRNQASVHDYSRFLHALWHERLPRSRELKRLMSLPNRDRLSPRGHLPPGTRVYDKTGSTRYVCGDMGILAINRPNGKRHAYTLIGVIEKRRPAAHYSRWLRSRGNVIREVAGIVHRAMERRYGAGHELAMTSP